MDEPIARIRAAIEEDERTALAALHRDLLDYLTAEIRDDASTAEPDGWIGGLLVRLAEAYGIEP